MVKFIFIKHLRLLVHFPHSFYQVYIHSCLILPSSVPLLIINHCFDNSTLMNCITVSPQRDFTRTNSVTQRYNPLSLTRTAIIIKPWSSSRKDADSRCPLRWLKELLDKHFISNILSTSFVLSVSYWWWREIIIPLY